MMRGGKPKYPEIVAMQPGDVLRLPAEWFPGYGGGTLGERHYRAAKDHSRNGGKGKRFTGMILPGPILRLERVE
jgi:hypothetical protein